MFPPLEVRERLVDLARQALNLRGERREGIVSFGEDVLIGSREKGTLYAREMRAFLDGMLDAA